MSVYRIGEWEIKELPSDDEYLYVHQNGITVAECSGEHKEINATLIAAAPDMWRALNKCVAVLERDLERLKQHELKGYPVIFPELEEAKKALSKIVLKSKKR